MVFKCISFREIKTGKKCKHLQNFPAVIIAFSLLVFCIMEVFWDVVHNFTDTVNIGTEVWQTFFNSHDYIVQILPACVRVSSHQS